MKNIVDKVEKVDDYTVRFVLKQPEAPFLADMAMDFASILSAEYSETMMKAGHARTRSTSIRSAPARSSSSSTRRTR